MTARFGIGSVLAASVRIWARNLVRFIAITALLYLPVIAWDLAVLVDAFGIFSRYYRFVFDLNPVLRGLPSGLFVVHACTTAAVAQGVLVALNGKPSPIGRSLAVAVRRFLPVVGVALIVQVVTLGVFAALLWLVSLLGDLDLAILGALLFYVVVLSVFNLVIPVAAAERRTVIGSIVRGFRLARGGRFRVFALVLLWQVAYWGGQQLLSLIVFSYRGPDSDAYRRAATLYGYINLGFHLVLFSLGAVIAAVSYRFLRDDKEGPATEQLVQVFE